MVAANPAAVGHLDALIEDPQNQKAKKNLATALASMRKVIEAQEGAAQNLLKAMGRFSTDIATDAETLSALAGRALDVAGADKAKVDEVNTVIDA